MTEAAMGAEMAVTPMLAGLIAQANEEGADIVTLRALIEEASELGAGRALRHVGLSDGAAVGDMTELRQVLQAWRDAKRTARNAVVAWVTRALMMALMGLLAVKLGLSGLVMGR